MKTIHIALAAALLVASGPALAQQTGSGTGGMSGGMSGSMQTMPGMQNMMGMHDMPATVSSIDGTTGIVDVVSEGMKLRVHFPPSALANVKSGDAITLHLAFTKP